VPGKSKCPFRRRRVNQTEEAKQCRGREIHCTSAKTAIEQLRSCSPPKQCRYDESVAEHYQSAQAFARISGNLRDARSDGAQNRIRLERGKKSEGRQYRDCHGKTMACGGCQKRLRNHFKPNVYKDGRLLAHLCLGPPESGDCTRNL